jgi:hypothetical protein
VLASLLAALLAVQVCAQLTARAEDEPPASSLPALRIESSDPHDQVSLYWLLPAGSVMRHGRPHPIYDRMLECGPPCQYRPDHQALFQVDGPGLVPSEPFVLGPDTKAVHVSMGSRAASVTGMVLYVPSALATSLLSLPAIDCAVHGTTADHCGPVMIAAIASALVAVGGLMLMSHNRTKVRVSPPD